MLIVETSHNISRRRAANEPANESQKARHREAQARYREKNRLKLRVQCWQYRYICSNRTNPILSYSLHGSQSKKREAETQRDEEEFQAFMALELDPEERRRIDAMHPSGVSGSS